MELSVSKEWLFEFLLLFTLFLQSSLFDPLNTTRCPHKNANFKWLQFVKWSAPVQSLRYFWFYNFVIEHPVQKVQLSDSYESTHKGYQQSYEAFFSTLWRTLLEEKLSCHIFFANVFIHRKQKNLCQMEVVKSEGLYFEDKAPFCNDTHEMWKYALIKYYVNYERNK